VEAVGEAATVTLGLAAVPAVGGTVGDVAVRPGATVGAGRVAVGAMGVADGGGGGGVEVGIGVDVGGTGVLVAVGRGVGVSASSNLKVAVAVRLIGGPMVGHEVEAVTVIWMDCPGVPLTENDPSSVPARPMDAEPRMVRPDVTDASPAGTAPPSHTQPLPLIVPSCDGASPDEGERAIEGAASAAGGALEAAQSAASSKPTASAGRAPLAKLRACGDILILGPVPPPCRQA